MVGAGLWKESALHESTRGGDFLMPVIVGDGIFPLGPHPIKPIPGQNLADYLQIFNYPYDSRPPPLYCAAVNINFTRSACPGPGA